MDVFSRRVRFNTIKNIRSNFVTNSMLNIPEICELITKVKRLIESRICCRVSFYDSINEFGFFGQPSEIKRADKTYGQFYVLFHFRLGNRLSRTSSRWMVFPARHARQTLAECCEQKEKQRAECYSRNALPVAIQTQRDQSNLFSSRKPFWVGANIHTFNNGHKLRSRASTFAIVD